MATNASYTNGLMNEQAPSIAWSVVRFVWHFVQMLVAMMVGMMIFHVLTGKPSETDRVIWYAGMELSMVPPMVALMLYQRHGWRHSAEMAAAMLIGPAVFLACVQLGLHNYIPGITRNSLFSLSDATMFLGMAGAMLYRREMYTRPHAGHLHAEAVDVHLHHSQV
ncbi:MAG: hypothetical protein ACM3S0_06095 [Acidobacteriota bacterium]